MARMYKNRKKNIAVFRGCNWRCCYCRFDRMLKLSNCPDCRTYIPHSHMEALLKKPPHTKDDEFLSIGLSGDISFMDVNQFCDVLDYCSKYGDRTFLIQSKNPEYFLQFAHRITNNVIIGTTIESDRLYNYNNDFMGNTCWYLRRDGGYEPISQAPSTIDRYKAMVKLNTRKAMTIEPVMDFFIDILYNWILDIRPEICWIGYNSSDNCLLPEPTLKKVIDLIKLLELQNIKVIPKLLRERIGIER